MDMDGYRRNKNTIIVLTVDIKLDCSGPDSLKLKTQVKLEYTVILKVRVKLEIPRLTNWTQNNNRHLTDGLHFL